MKILKYKKKKNGKYIVYFDNNQELELYEEVILKHNLLITKELDLLNMENVLDDQEFFSCYYEALRLIKIKLRTIYEVKTYLLKKEYKEEYVLDTIKKLEEQGYLNDLFYANSYLNQKLITTAHGPRKVYNELVKKGIKKDIVSQVLEQYDSEKQKEKVSKIINKMIRSNRSKSNNYLKSKIYTNLLRDGFEKNVIDIIISSVGFPDDSEIKLKEYEKIKKKLEKKYEGKELEFKIKQRLMQKGF